MLVKEKTEKAIGKIVERITEKRKLSNQQLIEICEQNGISVIGDKNNYHLIHEIL